jgi:dihydroflavonol-4-reductase
MMTDTILLTGVTGFIARHCAVKLLDAGYAVRGTLRDPAKGDEARRAIAGALKDPTAIARLSFAKADLMQDDGWEQAAQGATAIVHTASPFPLTQPKDAEELVRPAVDGTLRVLRAAKSADVQRVVLTSSIVAIFTSAHRVHDENDWLDPATPGTRPYAISKLKAERAAWDFANSEGIALTVINPGFILGPPLGRDFGSSISVIQRFLRGKDPMVPDMGFPIVDVRDVAEMHLRALQHPETAGKRYICAGESLSFADMTRALKDTFPNRKIPTRVAPNFVMRILGLFDSEIRSILPALGQIERVNNARARSEMAMTFIPGRDAVIASGRYLVDNALV